MITEDIKEGCSIIKNQAELLKIKFGSALANESQENEIVSIPGLRGREPKEISIKNLAHIIQARLEEIIEHIRKGPAEAAVDAVVELARSRMQSNNSKEPSKPDDLSVIVYRKRPPKRRNSRRKS